MIFAWISIFAIVMWYARATDPAVMQIIPNREVIIKGNPITFICTTKDSSSRYLFMTYKLTSPTDTHGEGLGYIDTTRPKAKPVRLQDIRGLPVSIDPGNVTGQFIASYPSATCANNAYTYDCLNSKGDSGNLLVRGTSPKTLTIIDNDDPVKLSDIKNCIGDYGKCARCGRTPTDHNFQDTGQNARSVGDKISVTCSKAMSFPKGGSNTFVWSKRNGQAEWREITRGIQGKIPKATITPVREDGKCLPKETKQSTLVYEVSSGDGPRMEFRCEVLLVLADGLNATTESPALELCIIGVTVAPPTTARPTDKTTGTTGKAGSKRPPDEETTTQKTKGKGTRGFSLQSGAGIAAVSASCVVLLAAVVVGVYLVVRRRRAAAESPAHAQSQNYDYDDVSQMSQTYNSEYTSYAA